MLQLASEGARAVVGDVDEAAGSAAAREADGLFVRTDVTLDDDVTVLFATAFETYGSVDVAFTNAGISPQEDDSILVTGLEAWRRVQEVNLTSVFLCCKAVSRTCSARARGRSSTPRRSRR